MKRTTLQNGRRFGKKWFMNLTFVVLFFPIGYFAESHAQKLTVEQLGKPREDIRFSDDQLHLFNGRSCIYVKQNSLNGLHNVQFPPIDIPQYQFRIDIRDDNNGILMQDNIPELWDEWKEKKSGYDPLGVNFRAGYH